MGTPAITVPTEPLSQRDQPTVSQLENQMVGNRAISFQVQNIPPPSALYISNDDTLQVTIANSLAGQSVIIVGQILLPDGRLQPNQWQVSPGSARAFQNFFFPLGEGYLMNISVAPMFTPTRRGQTWVQVGLRRGGAIGGSLVQLLISDYADSLYGGSWPGGSIHNSLEGRGYLTMVSPGNPAAGQNLAYTVPSNAHWVIDTISYNLVTSAAVANRSPGIFFKDDVGVMFWQDYFGFSLTASQSQSVGWGRMLGTAETAVNPAGWVNRSLPDLRLGPGYQVAAYVGSLQAADTISTIKILAEEFLSP